MFEGSGFSAGGHRSLDALECVKFHVLLGGQTALIRGASHRHVLLHILGGLFVNLWNKDIDINSESKDFKLNLVVKNNMIWLMIFTSSNHSLAHCRV